jgi:hypothetical protein
VSIAHGPVHLGTSGQGLKNRFNLSKFVDLIMVDFLKIFEIVYAKIGTTQKKIGTVHLKFIDGF